MIRINGDIVICRKLRLIAYGGESHRFGPCKFRLAEAMLCAGPKTTQELFDIIYRDRSDGGPLTFVRTIEVMLCKIPRDLAQIGLTAMSGGPHGRQRIFWIEIPAKPARLAA